MINPFRIYKRLGAGGIIGGTLAFIAGLVLLEPGWFRLPSDFGSDVINRSYDLLFIPRGTVPLNREDVRMVYLDDVSHEELKQDYLKGWNRDLHIRLLERLKREGARGAAFDIVFTGEGAGPAQLERFAAALTNTPNVVLACDLTHAVNNKGDAKRSSGPKGEFNLPAESVVPPHESLFNTEEDLGLDETQPDDDFTVRMHFATFHSDIRSLSWALAKKLKLPVTTEPKGEFRQRYLNYYGPPRTIPSVSYYQAIAPEGHPDALPKGYFHDKVVFVGANIKTFLAGQRKDDYISPFSHWTLGTSSNRGIKSRASDSAEKFMPGVEVHATMFLNLSRQDWLERLPRSTEATFLLGFGAFIGILLTQFRPVTATAAAVAIFSAIACGSYFLFSRYSYWFPWLILCGIQIPVSLAWSVLYNSVNLYVDKKLMQQSLSMYVSPKRVDQISRNQEMLRPGAVKQELSIMFSDIANFTSMSEGMDSDELARLMNTYFEKAVSNCIHPTEGTVVKYIGDAIFAIWNAPEQQKDHPALACKGALLLRDEVSAFLSSVKEGVDVRTRIGLHCGLANVGNFGSKSRVDYTAIGENINLASRMEGLNKYVGTDILITGDVHQRVAGRFTTRLAGRFRLKGFERAVEAHELIGLPDQAAATQPWRDAYAAALDQFMKRDFTRAEAGFRQVIGMRGGKDGPSQFMLKQLADLETHPLPDDWHGEIELKDK